MSYTEGVISYTGGQSKTAERGPSSDAIFRHARQMAASGVSSAHSAMAPQDPQVACALLRSDGLHASLLNPEGDQASYAATVERRLEAVRCLIEQPATTLSSVIERALVVSYHGRLTLDDETECGQLAIDLVDDLVEIREGDLDQVQLPPDSPFAQGCHAFFMACKAYEDAAAAVHQIKLSEINAARRHQAAALAAVMGLRATTLAEAAAKAGVVLHYSRRAVPDNATSLGLLAIAVLGELVSVLGGA